MAKKAATLGELQELHSLIAQSLNKRITQDMEDEIPTDAATQGPHVKLWYDRTLAAMFITLSDQRTEAGLTTLVDAGMLTAERKAAIVEAMK